MFEDGKDTVDKGDEPSTRDHGSRDSAAIDFPLEQETVWLKQHLYANAEMLYHMTVATGLPTKVTTKFNEDLAASSDLLDKKLQAGGSAVLKSVKRIWGQLEEIEKAQNKKAQVVRDVVGKLAKSVEDYQTNMSHELVHGVTRLNLFRSILRDVESAIHRSKSSLKSQKSGVSKTHSEHYLILLDHLSKLDVDLNSFFNVYNNLQGYVPKLDDVNHIVEEISKISVCTRNVDQFMENKDVVSSMIKSLLDDLHGTCDSDSDTSLEGSCSVYSDDSNSDTEKKTKSQAGTSKSKKFNQDTKQYGIRSNKNNANSINVGCRADKIKAKADSARPLLIQNISAMPIKRNSQGAHSTALKKPDLFQFRGVSSPYRVPFVNQPGLLGPRPNILPLQGANQSVPFRFSNFNPSGRQQVSTVSNSGTIHNLTPLSALGQPRYSSVHFNFPSSQSRPSPFDIGRTNVGQNSSLLASMGIHSSSPQGNHPAGNINSQLKQSKLLQIQQNQNKSVKGSDQLFGAKSGFFYPLQQNPRAPLFLQNSQAGVIANRSLVAVSHDSIEQQLNDMTQKIQQMQLATHQNLHLQQLMQETERLKQVVAQKQHQQQDQFKHQFQLLINAFMHQQQQQQMQAPQSKIARSVQFYNSQKQQQRSIHNRQQQTKKQKQDIKINQVKQETKSENSLLINTKQGSLHDKPEETGLQNGGQNSTLASDSRNIINENSKVARIGTFSPHAHGDKHRAGVSSVVVMEDIGCVVVVDIINSSLKLYNVTVTNTSPTELSYHLVTCLELSRPYYMSKLTRDIIVVSREGKILSLVRVSKNRLECLKDLKTETQYYGLGYVSDNVIVCAAFADEKIDLLNIKDGVTQTSTLLTDCKGPELVAAVPSTGCILYLGRVVAKTVHLLGISQKGGIDFSIDLESGPTDVWSVASIGDRIICCSKESGKVKLFSSAGKFVTDVNFPAGSVNQPFAMAFCDSGNMYIANDGAWDTEYEHYVTTEINAYTFS